MSSQGKKIAMMKHACDVAKSVIENAKTNFNNPFLLELGSFLIRHQSSFTMRQLQATPAERFNDDGSLKPEDMNNDKCSRCGNEGKEAHGCPYKEEINSDYETLCDCCEECRNKCYMDI